MRLDCQISLKSLPLNLLAGSVPASTQPLRIIRKLFVGVKRFQHFFSKSSREKYVHLHKYVAAKGTAIQTAFVAYSISANFAWWNTRNFRLLQHNQQSRHNCIKNISSSQCAYHGRNSNTRI